MQNIDKLRNLYNDLCQYIFFNKFSINYKTNTTDKFTTWKYYDDKNDLNILLFNQVYMKKISNTNVIDRNWYISKESTNFKYKQIDDIYSFINENESYLKKMTENYNNNVESIQDLNNIIGKYHTKNYKYVNWNFYNTKKTTEYIKIYIDLFLDNSLKNIKVIKKTKNKNEIEEMITITDLFLFINKLKQDIQKHQVNIDNTDLNNNIVNDIQNLSITTDNINDHYEIKPRKEISNTYKNLFIKRSLINRILTQTGKNKTEILEKPTFN